MTYGLRRSSFLATRFLLELVKRYGQRFPLAADALLPHTYVDDVNLAHNNASDLLQAKKNS